MFDDDQGNLFRISSNVVDYNLLVLFLIFLLFYARESLKWLLS